MLVDHHLLHNRRICLHPSCLHQLLQVFPWFIYSKNMKQCVLFVVGYATFTETLTTYYDMGMISFNIQWLFTLTNFPANNTLTVPGTRSRAIEILAPVIGMHHNFCYTRIILSFFRCFGTVPSITSAGSDSYTIHKISSRSCSRC